jgi:hypothetical protein
MILSFRPCSFYVRLFGGKSFFFLSKPQSSRWGVTVEVIESDYVLPHNIFGCSSETLSIRNVVWWCV